MVSIRCKMAVKEAMKKLGLHFIMVELGEVEIMENMTTDQRELLKETLFNLGFELMDDKKAILIQKIKKVIFDMIYHSDEMVKLKFSNFLSQKLALDYPSMANLFSEIQGTTIENFIIYHKIERIKELMMYGDLNLTEISWKMNYSSLAHLSAQFKKVTGLTPTHFKKLKDKRRTQTEKSEFLSLPVPEHAFNIN